MNMSIAHIQGDSKMSLTKEDKNRTSSVNFPFLYDPPLSNTTIYTNNFKQLDPSHSVKIKK